MNAGHEPVSIAGRGTLVFVLHGQKIRVFNVLHVPDCTQNLLSILADTTTGDKIVISHDDIVHPFVNLTLTSVFAAEGVQARLTVPSNSHRNGRYERAIDSNLDKASTIITTSSLPWSLFRHALHHAAFLLKNRSPFSKIAPRLNSGMVQGQTVEMLMSNC